MNSEQQYTSYLGLDIWVGTWNVNGKKIDENITPWLCAGGANHVGFFFHFCYCRLIYSLLD